MSANPSRLDCAATMTAEAATPLQAGNRVLETIARQESLQALLAFSSLHEQIRNRRLATGRDSDRDLFETERFILDEVLQLICDRAQVLTQADGIVIAFSAGSEVVCRAAAGPLNVERGVRLIGESEFLQDCMESGRILRSDDCEIDARVELDFARQVGARSTVLVPLRGRREQLGVLQALSRTPWTFTDHDIRCFDLFAELVLSALKPEDQDRRIHWLSDVADQVLQAKPTAAPPMVNVPVEIPSPGTVASETALEALKVPPAVTPTAVTPPLRITTPAAVPAPEPIPELVATAPIDVVPPAQIELSETAIELTEPAAVDELTEVAFAPTFPSKNIEIGEIELDELDGDEARADVGLNGSTSSHKAPRILPFPIRVDASLLRGSRPGLTVVLGLVAVAALFSAGAWWGMQAHDKTSVSKTIVSKAFLPESDARLSPQSITTPAVPAAEILSPVSDNLMNTAKPDSDDAPLIPVAADKLAGLPKVTGVRHWSSSIGSTVVIDMEDQVPYEVHRLMSPERIYFDLHDTGLARDLDGATMDVGDASLSRVRVAQPVAGVTRVVLDTRDGSNFSVSMESNPYRLVVELHSKDNLATHVASNRVPAPATVVPAKTAPVSALAAKASDQTVPAKTGRLRIVLDAGHGGWDLGTVGRQGLLEKDLVLDVTQRLGKLLQSRLGSEVMFTRTGDAYLPLDQRADIANQAQADLFVSIHANYSSSASARGVETYYTNLFSAPGSRELEKHDDGISARLTPVSLSAGGLREKIEESRKLAASVQRSLYATVAANSPDIRNRGIKDASFAVLTGTTMPAVLTEISFVSSPADEQNLQSAAYRQRIAEALYQGIARYQQASPRARVAQLQTTATRR